MFGMFWIKLNYLSLFDRSICETEFLFEPEKILTQKTQKKLGQPSQVNLWARWLGQI